MKDLGPGDGSVKCLKFKQEDLSADPQHTCDKLRVIGQTPAHM